MITQDVVRTRRLPQLKMKSLLLVAAALLAVAYAEDPWYAEFTVSHCKSRFAQLAQLARVEVA